MKTPVTELLRCEHPIIQAPLAGGGDTPELVAAVANAGAFGFIGAGYLDAKQIAKTAARVRELTQRPFGINLFAPTAPSAAVALDRAIERLAPYFAELGLPPPASAVPSMPRFEDQLAAALDGGASAFSFTFGMVPSDAIAALRSRGLSVIGTATTVAEAVALQDSGVDAIVTQGTEAGGHRGTFLGDFAAAQIGTIALVPQVVDAVRVPVIASGGIMDGRGIAAALALGAGAAQLGTAFLTTHEAGVPEVYKDAIARATEDGTRVTRAFSGRHARGIINRFMREIDTPGSEIPGFPIQNQLTRPLRTAAAKQGRAEFLSLWAGQGVRMARRESAEELVARLVEETTNVIRRLPN
jgi:nitronate monooxygenase